MVSSRVAPVLRGLAIAELIRLDLCMRQPVNDFVGLSCCELAVRSGRQTVLFIFEMPSRQLGAICKVCTCISLLEIMAERDSSGRSPRSHSQVLKLRDQLRIIESGEASSC